MDGVALAAAYLEGRAGKQSGPGRANQSASLPIASTRGRGKKDRARHVFRQHGFHAGPRASLPAFSLCVPSRSLNLDGWGGRLAECLQGQAGKQSGPGGATQSASRPTPPPEGGKKDRARHVFRQHGFHAGPRASLPAVSLCVPSRSLNLDGWGGPLAECLQGQEGKQRGPGGATQSASPPIAAPP